MSDDAVRVKIGADTSEFEAGAERAGGASEGFAGKLRELKSEGATAGRTARYFANELSAIIPGADGATGALKSLISIGLEGFGIGAALTATALVAEELKKAFTEAAAEAAELRRIHEEAMNAIEDGVRNAIRAYDAWKTSTQLVEQSLEDGVNAKVRALRQEAAALRADTKESIFGDFFGTDAEKIDTINSKIHTLQASLTSSKAQSLLGGLQGQENVAESNRVNAEIVTLTAQSGDEIFRIKTELAGKTAELDHKIYKATLDDNTDLAATYEQEKQALAQASAQRISDIRIQREQQGAQALIAATATTEDSRTRIIEEGEAKVAALKEQYRKRNSSADQLDLQLLVAATQASTARKLELDEAAAQNARTQAATHLQQLRDQRIEHEVSTAKAVQALQDQMEDEHFGLRYAQAAAAIRAREQQETDLVRQALNEHVIDEQKAQALISEIQDKASDERARALQRENQSFINDFVRPMESAFTGAIRSMIDGTRSLADAMKAFASGALNAVIDGLIKIGIAEVENAAIRAAAAAAKGAADKATNVSGTQGAIATASSEAATSVAWLGPEAAIAAAAATAAGLEALTTPMLSAAGGFDIPAGVNPIVQLHQREMVLPAPLADPLRDALAGGGLGGDHVTIHVQALDGASAKAYFESPAFARTWAEARRNGRIP